MTPPQRQAERAPEAEAEPERERGLSKLRGRKLLSAEVVLGRAASFSAFSSSARPVHGAPLPPPCMQRPHASCVPALDERNAHLRVLLLMNARLCHLPLAYPGPCIFACPPLPGLYLAHHCPHALAGSEAGQATLKFWIVVAMATIPADTVAFVSPPSVVRHASGEIMILIVWLTRLVDRRGARAILLAMRSGIDYAQLTPSREKPDQWERSTLLSFAIISTTNYDEPANSAAAVQEEEFRVDCIVS
ncbi:MAG: hypothetical protein SGPRY_002291 [Prymnesium sp.]